MKTHKTPQGTELPILNLRGKDYLEVKYRIKWFTEEKPNWSIETEYIAIGPNSATAKATIRNSEGRIMATSHKHENSAGFPDYLEKSETGAIGRALALLGFGTQFCGDELDEGERIVDSPVVKPNPHAAKNNQPGPLDGYEVDTGYHINFGKYNRKTLEQIARDEGPKAIESYVEYLENYAQKNNKPLSVDVQKFIKEAEIFLKAMYQDLNNKLVDFNSAP